VSALIAELRAAGRTVGVIAVDPSSPITGGALLGDRVRMQAYASDPDVFIRSMASRGHAGGLASTSAAAAATLDAVGFGIILLETVGTGQSEVEVAASADTTVVLEAPEMGDEVQAIKAGLLEVADIVVVNKGDRPGAQRTAAQLRAMLTAAAKVGQDASTTRHHGAHLPPTETAAPPTRAAPSGTYTSTGPTGPTDRPRPKQPQVMVATALTGDGIPELLAAIDAHAGATDASTAKARATRAEAQVWAILGDRLRARLDEPAHRDEADAILADVVAHRLDPFAAADRLLSALER
jgi:LAO/AO transport system kinase